MTKTSALEASKALNAGTRMGHTGKLLLAFVVLMGIALVIFGWEDALLVASRTSPWDLAILCLLAAAHYVIRAGRWHSLVRVNGADSSFGANMRHFFGGFAMTATPGRVGELVRLRWLQLETGRGFGGLLPIAFADRAMELAAMLLVIVGALAFSNLETNAVWGLLLVCFAIVVVSCRPALLEGTLGGIWRLIGRRKGRIFVKLRRAIRSLGPSMRPKVLLPLLTVGALGWLIEGYAFWLLLGWLDISVPFPAAAAIFLVAILAGALSGLPGGFGGMEATGVALLVLQGVASESAVVAIVIIRLATLWFAVLVGLVVFPFAEAGATQTQRDRLAARGEG